MSEGEVSMNIELAQAVAFLGNSLLRPMSQTGDYGLNPAFWESFPIFNDAETKAASRRMADYVGELQRASENTDEAITRVSVEFTKLFVGPPSPKVNPWETYYVTENAKTGYGQPAIEVNMLLKSMGLKIGGEGNQFPDHMGIELLCLSELLLRASEDNAAISMAVRFCKERPLAWMEQFRAALSEEAPDGYFDHLTNIAECLLKRLVSSYNSVG